MLERELVDAFDQHGQAIAGAERHSEQLVAPPTGQDQPGQPGRSDGMKLLIAALEPTLEPGAEGIRAGRERGEDDQPLGCHALLDQPAEALLDQ